MMLLGPYFWGLWSSHLCMNQCYLCGECLPWIFLIMLAGEILARMTKLLLLNSLLQEVCSESGLVGLLTLSLLRLSAWIVSYILCYSGLKKVHWTKRSINKQSDHGILAQWHSKMMVWVVKIPNWSTSQRLFVMCLDTEHILNLMVSQDFEALKNFPSSTVRHTNVSDERDTISRMHQRKPFKMCVEEEGSPGTSRMGHAT
jgi:hypothetical protein